MQSWGLTDPGCVRKQNQDAYRIEQLDREALKTVASETREAVLNRVSKHGGHIGPPGPGSR